MRAYPVVLWGRPETEGIPVKHPHRRLRRLLGRNSLLFTGLRATHSRKTGAKVRRISGIDKENGDFYGKFRFVGHRCRTSPTA